MTTSPKKKNVRKFVGDGFVTTKEVLRRAKENRVVYIGRVKKNWIVEVFGKKFRPENIIKEYLKRFWIEEKHRRDKSILKLEGNYLGSERSNSGFILLTAMLSNRVFEQ